MKSRRNRNRSKSRRRYRVKSRRNKRSRRRRVKSRKCRSVKSRGRKTRGRKSRGRKSRGRKSRGVKTGKITFRKIGRSLHIQKGGDVSSTGIGGLSGHRWYNNDNTINTFLKLNADIIKNTTDGKSRLNAQKEILIADFTNFYRPAIYELISIINRCLNTAQAADRLGCECHVVVAGGDGFNSNLDPAKRAISPDIDVKAIMVFEGAPPTPEIWTMMYKQLVTELESIVDTIVYCLNYWAGVTEWVEEAGNECIACDTVGNLFYRERGILRYPSSNPLGIYVDVLSKIPTAKGDKIFKCLYQTVATTQCTRSGYYPWARRTGDMEAGGPKKPYTLNNVKLISIDLRYMCGVYYSCLAGVLDIVVSVPHHIGFVDMNLIDSQNANDKGYRKANDTLHPVHSFFNAHHLDGENIYFITLQYYIYECFKMILMGCRTKNGKIVKDLNRYYILRINNLCNKVMIDVEGEPPFYPLHKCVKDCFDDPHKPIYFDGGALTNLGIQLCEVYTKICENPKEGETAVDLSGMCGGAPGGGGGAIISQRGGARAAAAEAASPRAKEDAVLLFNFWTAVWIEDEKKLLKNVKKTFSENCLCYNMPSFDNNEDQDNMDYQKDDELQEQALDLWESVGDEGDAEIDQIVAWFLDYTDKTSKIPGDCDSEGTCTESCAGGGGIQQGGGDPTEIYCNGGWGINTSGTSIGKVLKLLSIMFINDDDLNAIMVPDTKLVGVERAREETDEEYNLRVLARNGGYWKDPEGEGGRKEIQPRINYEKLMMDQEDSDDLFRPSRNVYGKIGAGLNTSTIWSHAVDWTPLFRRLNYVIVTNPEKICQLAQFFYYERGKDYDMTPDIVTSARYIFTSIIQGLNVCKLIKQKKTILNKLTDDEMLELLNQINFFYSYIGWVGGYDCDNLCGGDETTVAVTATWREWKRQKLEELNE
jgi:hypothetical protein